MQCPKCRAQFPAPEPEIPKERPRSRPTEEVTDSPRPRRPRFSEANEEGVSRTRRPADFDRGADDYEDEEDVDRPPPGEYTIDLGRWFNVAGSHYSSYFGPAIGFMFVAGIISGVCNGIIGGIGGGVGAVAAPNDPLQRLLITQLITQTSTIALSALLVFPLASGTTAVCLAQLKGRPWSFGDFFSGFRHWASLAGVGLITQLISVFIVVPIVVMIPFYIQNRDPRLIFAAVAILVFGMAIMAFVYTRLLIFAPALIFDRRLGAIDALKANWELTRGHFLGLFGASIVVGLISVIGFLGCGIGILFTIPYAALILNAGYLFIAGRREPIDKPYISND